MSKNKHFWTQKEDELLTQAVNEINADSCFSWKSVFQRMLCFHKQGFIELKSPKQCRDRWVNYLSISSEVFRIWTDEEDAQLIELNREHGNKWTKIASLMNQRTENQVKHRYYSVYRKKLSNLIKEYLPEDNKSLKHHSIRILSSKIQSTIKYADLTSKVAYDLLIESDIIENKVSQIEPDQAEDKAENIDPIKIINNEVSNFENNNLKKYHNLQFEHICHFELIGFSCDEKSRNYFPMEEDDAYDTCDDLTNKSQFNDYEDGCLQLNYFRKYFSTC